MAFMLLFYWLVIYMSKVYVGYVSGVHGLRGDLKVKNRFEQPERVFQVGTKIYLNNEIHEISACKLYKGYYLCTVDNIKDINKVEKYIGYDVFIDRDALNLKTDEYILDDLYGLSIECDGKNFGKVKEIINNGIYNILVINFNKEYMIPLIDEYIDKVDLENNTIICKNIEGLMI